MVRRIQFGGGVRSARLDTYGYGSPRWANALNGQGTEADRSADTMFLPGAPLPGFTIDALMQFQGVARRIVTREQDDAMREGIDFDGLSAEQKDVIADEFDRLGVIPKIKKARMFEHAFGGGAAIMFIADGRLPHEPVDEANIRRVASILPVDRYNLRAEDWEGDPSRENIGEPKSWRLQSVRSGRGSALTGQVFHASRVLPFTGLELGSDKRVLNDGWGGSKLDLVWAALSNFGSTHQFAAEAVSLFTQGVFKTDVAKALESDKGQELVDRMKAMRQGMGIMGDLVIDKGGEEYEILTRPLNGIAEALEAFVSYLVMCTDMPRSILLGESPGGLNTGENAGETRSWYDHVAAGRESAYGPIFKRLVRYLMLARNGPFRGQQPQGWSIKWPKLWQLTELEKADLRIKNAQARNLDVQGGIVRESEARLDPDLPEHYPELDLELNAPGLPGGGGGFGFGGDGEDQDDPDEDLLAATDESLIPPGEVPMTARQLGELLGVPASRIRGWARRAPDQVHMFRPGGMGQGLYLKSEVLRYIGASKTDSRSGGAGRGPFAGTATG